jgi:hypothetical protein
MLFHRKSIATINVIEHVLVDANSYLAYSSTHAKHVTAGPDMIICPILSPYPYLRVVSSPVSSCRRWHPQASDLLRIRIFTIVIIKALYHHCTFDDRTKSDTTWDGPYHNGVSRSRIMIRLSLPVHICYHDTRRRYGYGDRIGQMMHVPGPA